MAELDAPRRVIRKGSLSDIPKFNPVEELLKAGRYAKFGHAENTSGNQLYAANLKDNMARCLDALEGEMSAAQMAKKLGCSQSGAYRWLIKLGEAGLVDSREVRIGMVRTVLFSKINTVLVKY